jgi:hypothetical protein
MPKPLDAKPEIAKSDESSQVEGTSRRAFLKTVGDVAVTTPVVLTMLAAGAKPAGAQPCYLDNVDQDFSGGDTGQDGLLDATADTDDSGDLGCVA